MARIMVFSPHPDDGVIGCGGSIINHVKKGDDVTIVYMTSGDAGSLRVSKKALGRIREEEAKNAGRILGVKELVFLRNPDGYLEYKKDNFVNIISLIRRKKPNLVYIPHKDESHRDHTKTFELASDAVERAGCLWFQECNGKPWKVDSVLCYEVWTPLRDVTYVEDITETIDRKLAAIIEHKSQIQNHRYDEAAKSLNKYRGIMMGKGGYSECFQILKTNRVKKKKQQRSTKKKRPASHLPRLSSYGILEYFSVVERH
ncbi:Diacetylchitobiose deacetylase [uncultured archaeon]|nr:Diacetylchitobiose deacetylase [uncultured archaeon]